MRMNQEIKTAWIAALRSCNYEQGHGALKMTHKITGDSRHCSLGVLCEVVGKDAGYTEEIEDNTAQNGYNEDYYYIISFRNSERLSESYITLPTGIAKHCEFLDPEFEDKLEQLVLMNDSVPGASFAEIAVYIDKEF